jgi:hypothetical protein
MKTYFRIPTLLLLIVLTFGGLQSCKRDPSVLKVYVRSSNNELEGSAKVVIIGDVNSNPPTNPYVDTVLTNSTGFATFDMTEYFGDKGKKGATGYFDIVVKKDERIGKGRIRCRSHVTNVATVYLEP